MTDEYVGVHLLDAPYAIDRVYDYRIPSRLRGEVHRGSFVTVPFGKGNRRKLALVVRLGDTTEYEGCKPIDEVQGKQMALDEHMLGLALFMKEQTLCTVGDAVRAMVPTFAISRTVEVFRAADGAADRLYDAATEEDAQCLTYLLAEGAKTRAELRTRLGGATDEVLARLGARRLIVRDHRYRDVESTDYIPCRRLTVDRETAKALLEGGTYREFRLRTAKQREIVRRLYETQDSISDKALCAAVGCTVSVPDGLCAAGILEKYKLAVERDPYAAAKDAPPAKPPVLNEQQRAAYTTLAAMADSEEPHAALLHGVTGSGKTAVMLALIEHLRKAGKGAIVLLPEIALTPQSIAIFCARFGDTVAVIHSSLSAGERYDAYRRIREGLATVVVGTRSAVFAPVKNLGAIIIDEEQEHTYKSDQNPKYHARDIARYRCAKASALMLLASATPSLESYHKAMTGHYTLVKLPCRYGEAVLPRVIIADTRREAATGNTSPLGTLLCGELAQNLQAGKQSILFLNRRGYHRYVACRSCGQALTCERCSVTMTYHTRQGDYGQGEMVCHLCGSRRPLPSVCPACGSEHLSRNGYGTQRIEQELGELLPGSRVLRMDTDTTNSKFSYDRMLSEFRDHKADILLGTQMVTKGHDFPDVTLVGVLNADASLYVDDYRAGERTFSQLTQVIGRAGRSKTPGRAVIQTANPDHDIIRLACAQDYETFYAREIKLRQLLVFPPFCDLALLTLSGKDERAVLLAAERALRALQNKAETVYADVPLQVFGPFEAPVYRVDERYRMRMVVKCRLNARSRALLAELLRAAGQDRSGVSLSIDLNPSSL